jgi:thiol:disulfide interchange protein DsbD
MRRFILSLISCLFLTTLQAQQKPVTFVVEAETADTSKAGLRITAIIAPGVQLLSHEVTTGFEDLRSQFVPDSTSAAKMKGPLQGLLPTKKQTIAALDNTVFSVFTDSAVWFQPVNLSAGDSFRVRGQFVYYALQGDEILNLSESVSREFVTAVSPAAATTPANNDDDRSAWGWLVAGIAAGLIGFLTPCVYSLVPVTVSLFLKRSKTPAEGRKSAIVYSSSIVMIYTLVGILSVLFVPQATWNIISTSWGFNLFVFALFILFGISFLGAFEISLPSSWATKLDSKSSLGSYSGIFFMALTLVVVSFSCTGNFVASLLGIASKTNKLAAILGMTGFGLGLALPFALFAFFPSWLKEISKPGGWQNVLKVSLGILELALAMKFLSNVDIQLGTYWFTRDVYLAIWIALFAFLTVYLLGGFRMKHDSELPKNDWSLSYISVPRFFFALASLAFTLYLIPGLWGAPLNPISGLLPPYGTQSYTTQSANHPSASTNGHGSTSTYQIRPVKYVDALMPNESAAAKQAGLVTFFDYEEALAAAKEQQKPLMIDFTGIVCPNCREFENRVWTIPDVMNRMKNNFVVASLFEDYSLELADKDKRFSPLLQQELRTVGDQFKELSMQLTGGISQPNYVFLDTDGNKLVDKGYGYDDVQKRGPMDFARHMDSVVTLFQQRQAKP